MNLPHSVLCRLLTAFLAIACVMPLRAAEPPPRTELRVYHIGNSLTRNIPLERLQNLFESVGGKYEYGTQLGGGIVSGHPHTGLMDQE